MTEAFRNVRREMSMGCPFSRWLYHNARGADSPRRPAAVRGRTAAAGWSGHSEIVATNPISDRPPTDPRPSPAPIASAATVEARRLSAAETRAFHKCNIPDVEWSVEVTDEFKTWWHDLDEDEQVSVAATVTLLEVRGTALGFPYSSGVKGSRHGHMRELRIQHRGQPYRILYAFDPRRTAIVEARRLSAAETRAFHKCNIPDVEWSVEVTDEFKTWWHDLDEDEQVSVAATVTLLEVRGTALGFPYSSGVKGSRHGHMRELRIQHRGQPYRILYAFDPRRTAILLIGGRKTGDDRWYERLTPRADAIYDAYLDELRKEGLVDEDDAIR